MAIGDVLSGIGDALSGIGGFFGTAYNLFTNKRDFDYQKALQQQMFEREDTAVQRRVEDLKAAGMNPFLAAGSSAGAGSVVSRSNTNDINPGTALDMLQAAQNLRRERQETKNAELTGEILEQEKKSKQWDAFMSKLNNYNSLGIPYVLKQVVDPDDPNNSYIDTFLFADNDNRFFSKESTPLYKLFDYQFQNQKNSAAYLEKEVKWQTAQNIADMLGVASGYIPRVNFSFGKKLK